MKTTHIINKKNCFVKVGKITPALKFFIILGIIITTTTGFHSCKDETVSQRPIIAADAAKPSAITKFTPDSGGIATKMLIYGENFGTDTSKIRVYFHHVDPETNTDTLIRGWVISSDGDHIYLNVPKLTNRKNLTLQVNLKLSNNETRIITSNDIFRYSTQTTVTTVAGVRFSTISAAVTQGGTLSSASFTAPMFICVDSAKNVIVVERTFLKAALGKDLIDADMSPKTANGDAMSGDFLMVNEAQNMVTFMQKAQLVNAPTISPNGQTIYVPTDAGVDYYQMNAAENYTPRLKRLKLDDVTKTIVNPDKNWKFSFVTRKTDGAIYTIMYMGQLLKIDPKTNVVSVICRKYNFGQGPENDGGVDTYVMFDPNNPNIMYASGAGSHTIFKIRFVPKRDANNNPVIDPYTGQPMDTVSIVPWAGGMAAGLSSGASKGWADIGLQMVLQLGIL